MNFIVIPMSLMMLLILSDHNVALASESGASLFSMHCSGCHINGGNIIRRGKTLKKNALIKNDIYDQDSIARIAREGIGSMSGYKKVLGDEGDKIVAIWVLEQAQNAWVQG